MKKLLIASLVLMALLTGCGSDKTVVDKDDNFENAVIGETIIKEDIIEEDILTEDIIEEDVWVSDEYKAEVEYNSQKNDWG